MEIGLALFDVIFKPGAALRRISRNKPVSSAILVFLLVSFMVSLTPFLAGDMIQTNPLLAVILSFSASMFRLVGVLIASLFLFLVSRFFRGRGSLLGVFSALGFAHFVFILLPLVEFIGVMQGGLEFFVIWFRYIIFIWFALLFVLSVRESQGFTTLRALITIAATFLLVVILSGFVGFSFLALLM